MSLNLLEIEDTSPLLTLVDIWLQECYNAESSSSTPAVVVILFWLESIEFCWCVNGKVALRNGVESVMAKLLHHVVTPTFAASLSAQTDSSLSSPADPLSTDAKSSSSLQWLSSCSNWSALNSAGVLVRLLREMGLNRLRPNGYIMLWPQLSQHHCPPKQIIIIISCRHWHAESVTHRHILIHHMIAWIFFCCFHLQFHLPFALFIWYTFNPILKTVVTCVSSIILVDALLFLWRHLLHAIVDTWKYMPN